MGINYPPPFLKRVQTRMVLLITAAIGVIALGGAVFLYGFVASATWSELSADGISLTKIIRQSVGRYITSDGHGAELEETFAEVAFDDDASEIRVLDMTGAVRHSTVHTVNNDIGRKIYVCGKCHISKATKPANNYIEIRTGSMASPRLRSIATINSEKACEGCHGKSNNRHLGVIVMDISIKSHDVFLAKLRDYSAATAFVTIIIIFGIVTLGFRRTVTRPISKIIEGLAAVGAGDLTKPLDIHGEGEVALLAEAFEKMRDDLATRAEEVKQRDTHIEELDFLRKNLEAANASLNFLVSELSLLNNISATANATLNLDELVEKVSGVIRETLDLENISLFMFSEKTQSLELKAATGLPPEATARARTRPGEGIAGSVFQASLPMVIKDVRTEESFDYHAGIHPDTRSLVAIPLTVREKNTGVLCISSRKPGVFTYDELPFYSAVANHLAIALDNARLYELQRELATKDSLTGLCNHGCFQSSLNAEVSRVLRYPRPLSALMIDIDHFKVVNDTFGHQTGDTVLTALSRIIEAQTREVDIAARYGGEEFSVMLPETDLEGARIVAERIRTAAEAGDYCLGVCAEPAHITISIGVSEFQGDGDSSSDLIGRADKALYRAKHSGRNRVEVEDAKQGGLSDSDGI